MTDAANAESWVAIAAAIITVVGSFLAWAQGDKEGGAIRSDAVREVIGVGVANREATTSLIEYLEEIIRKLDMLILAVKDREGEELRKNIAEDTRAQIVKLLDEIKERTDGTK